MAFQLNLQIARVHLFSRRRQTIIAMLGVTFGISMFILMISFMKGVNKFLEDLTMSTTADIRIYNKLNTDYSNSLVSRHLTGSPQQWIVVRHPKPKQITLNLKNASSIVADLQQFNKVTAVSPLLSSLVIFNYGPVQWAATVDGVDIMAEDRLFGLTSRMVAGKPEDLLRMDNGIIMGYKLAADLNLTIGDLVTLTTQSGTQLRCRLTGLFKFGIVTMDEYKAYVNLATMQQLLGKPHDYITDIRVKVKELEDAAPLAAIFTKRYGYPAEDWETVNASIKAGNTIRDTLTWIVSFTLLIVAGFGIYNIMNMVITSKLKDIAILKAQGFSGRDIMQIFLSQSLIIGILGGMAGLLLGFGMSYALSRVPFPDDGYVSLKFFPVLFEGIYYFFGMFFGILTTFLAGMLPALKASKIDPVAILRA